MGLFGKKKDYTELALEEARGVDAADALEGAAPEVPAEPKRTEVKSLSFKRSFTTSSLGGRAVEALMDKAFEGALMDASKAAPGESVSVTTVRHWGADDAQMGDAMAALGWGPNAPLQLPGAGPQEPDTGFSAALDAIERDYRGKPVADAKAAIEAALQEHHHTVPDLVVAMIAKNVSEGTSIDVKFGGSPQTP